MLVLLSVGAVDPAAEGLDLPGDEVYARGLTDACLAGDSAARELGVAKRECCTLLLERGEGECPTAGTLCAAMLPCLAR